MLPAHKCSKSTDTQLPQVDKCPAPGFLRLSTAKDKQRVKKIRTITKGW